MKDLKNVFALSFMFFGLFAFSFGILMWAAFPMVATSGITHVLPAALLISIGVIVGDLGVFMLLGKAES